MSKPSNGVRELTMGAQLRSDWPLVLLIIITLVAGFLLYPRLPEQVPSHWNIRGEVNAYASRFWGAFGIPLMNAGIYLLMLVTPYLDPRRHNYVKFAGSYRAIKAILIIFLTWLYVVVTMSSLGYNVSVERLVPLGVSLVIIIIGNQMGKIQHNYFVGIKVPWTLASEVVWRKTHRLAGPLWVAAGLAGVVGAIIGGYAAALLLFLPLVLAAVIPVVYSYLLYKRLQS